MHFCNIPRVSSKSGSGLSWLETVLFIPLFFQPLIFTPIELLFCNTASHNSLATEPHFRNVVIHAALYWTVY